MGLFKSHPSTAVTEIINGCCSRGEIDDDFLLESQLSSLIDAIKSQNDFVEPGAVEAARALRKKMKYGDVKEQIIALKLLDLLVINGVRAKFMQPLFNDEKLLDRLEFYVNDKQNFSSGTTASYGRAGEPNFQIKHRAVCKLAKNLMAQWYDEFNDFESMRNFNQIFERNIKKKSLAYNDFEEGTTSYRSRINDEVPDYMNDEADMDFEFDTFESNKPKTNAELDRKFKIPKINYEKEAPKILQLIAEANIMATNLMNILNSLEKDELSIHSIRANDAFDQCRSIRRKVLRYLQLVQKEELLGPLLKCNDDLVASLQKYEAKSIPGGAKVQQSEDDDDDYDSLADYESDNEPSDRYVREEPPSVTHSESTSSTSTFTKRAPPPVPRKSNNLRSSYQDPQEQIHARPKLSDFDPFSDDNEVAPSPAW